jgi:anaerobic selenocysteine-containing dehydrogenase
MVVMAVPVWAIMPVMRESVAKLSVCRNCGSMCPIVVTIEDGQVVRVDGDHDAPIYKGFICPKGTALPKQQAMPNRLLHSLKRLPDGRRVPISGEQLVEEIAAKLARIIDESGPAAVAAFLGGAVAEQPAAAGMMLSFLIGIRSPMMFTNATIDQPGLMIAQALHGTWEGGRIHQSEWQAWLIVGGNPVASKQHLPQNPAQQLKTITKAGAQLIVIDPRRSETAQRAAVHLQLIPGEDPTVLAGLIHLIFELGGVDSEFVHQNAEGMEELRAAVRDFTPEYVAARAGINQEELVTAAAILIGARTGDTALGTGPSMATRGTLSSYLALCIQTLRGFWAREGAAVSRPHVLLPRATARAQPSAPRPGWGFGLKTSVRGLQQTAAGMPTAALPGLMMSKGPDRVRALFLHSGAMYTWPQHSLTAQALGALDLLVMHDVQLSATSALAHYVIATRTQLEVPAMSQIAEVSGFVHPGYDWTEPYAFYRPATVEPPPGADLLESWQIYYRVAQKLGVALEYAQFAATGAPAPKFDMAHEPTTDELYELMCQDSAVPLARVKEFTHGGVFDEARAVVQARDPACRARLQLADAAMLQELRAVRRENVLARRKTSNEFPFLLVSRRLQNCTNSAPRVDGIIRTGYNPAFMNPDDMRRLGIGADAEVQIRSRHGAITGFVQPDADLRPGVVAMTHGFGPKYGVSYDPRRDGSNVNELICWDDDFDPYHGMPRMGAVPIAITAVETPAATRPAAALA